jgi:hypothetical protein
MVLVAAALGWRLANAQKRHLTLPHSTLVLRPLAFKILFDPLLQLILNST